jgi:DNA-binding transcriptional MerR regulator
MDEKLLNMKEAAKILGCSVRTLQRQHQADGLRCVLTPGGRRRVPENEILRLKEEMGLGLKTEATKRTLRTRPKKRVISHEEPPIMPARKEEPKKSEQIPATTIPQALSDFEIIERMAPESLPMRKAFNDLLATAAMLENFTSKQILERSNYPEQTIKSFCDRLAAKNLASLENDRYTLKVRLVR